MTPIVRVKHGKKYINFFTVPEYQQWAENNKRVNGWSAKYYKGLGTSEDKDAMAYFSDMPTHMIPFSRLKDDDRKLIDMAFSKKKVEDRKEWLRNFVVSFLGLDVCSPQLTTIAARYLSESQSGRDSLQRVYQQRIDSILYGRQYSLHPVDR